MIRVVVDPGVFISALIGPRGGAPDLVVRGFADDRIEVVASPLTLHELERVLRRPKFARYVEDRAAREFVQRIRRHATVVEDPPDQPPATRDRKDDYMVALARKEGLTPSSAATATSSMPAWRTRRLDSAPVDGAALEG